MRHVCKRQTRRVPKRQSQRVLKRQSRRVQKRQSRRAPKTIRQRLVGGDPDSTDTEDSWAWSSGSEDSWASPSGKPDSGEAESTPTPTPATAPAPATERETRRVAETETRRAAERETQHAPEEEIAAWRPAGWSREQLAKVLGAEYKKNDRVLVEEEGEDRVYVLLDLGRGMLGWAQLRNPNEGIKRGNLHQPLRDEYAVKLLRGNRSKRQAYRSRKRGTAARTRKQNRHVGPSSEVRLKATKARERQEAEVLRSLFQQSQLPQKNPVYDPAWSAALYSDHPVSPTLVEIRDKFDPPEPRRKTREHYAALLTNS